MTYDLYIGARTFSSWSLRGWLMFDAFDLPVRTHMVGLYDGTLSADLAPLAPARLVPVMRTPDGIVVGDTLAMAETLAERHPDADLWPADPAARGLARWMVAEMHSGFGALRTECPMRLDHAVGGNVPSDAVRADLARIETLWSLAAERHGGAGDWLFGAYSLADVFYAAVAARIAAYDLPVGAAAEKYVARHLAHPSFLRWRAAAASESFAADPYPSGQPSRPWPGPA